MTMPKSMDELGKTILPASFFEQNIVTAVKENLDPEELERNREAPSVAAAPGFPSPLNVSLPASSADRDKNCVIS